MRYAYVGEQKNAPTNVRKAYYKQTQNRNWLIKKEIAYGIIKSRVADDLSGLMSDFHD